MEQNISICPVCGHVYGHSVAEQIPCGDCGKSLTTFSGYSSDSWNKLSASEKKDIIKAIKANQDNIESPNNYTTTVVEDPVSTNEATTTPDPMLYQNPGHAISAYARICCIASIILDLLVAIGLYSLLDSFLVSAIVFAVMCVMSYLSYLLLAGFGTLVENSSKILQKLEQ